jgi:uncharacterized UBP type Zn finger protein
MQALSVTRALGSITEEDTPQCVRDNSSSLTCAFVEVLKGMRTSQGGVYNPKALHTAVRNRWRQFKGFRQEDAHELIRCMLDGLQEDERKVIGSNMLYCICTYICVVGIETCSTSSSQP